MKIDHIPFSFHHHSYGNTCYRWTGWWAWKDIIIGPIGIVIADSMYGEVTPKMAVSVSQARAKRILIPVNLCDNIVVGVPDTSLSAMIDGVIKAVEAAL